jgi:ATP-dependent helicase YprA (DUF1998 family)
MLKELQELKECTF